MQLLMLLEIFKKIKIYLYRTIHVNDLLLITFHRKACKILRQNNSSTSFFTRLAVKYNTQTY